MLIDSKFYTHQKTQRIFNLSKAFTLIELLISIGIIIVLIASVYLLVNPAQQTKKAKDSKSLSILYKLEGEIIDFRIDNDRYPDANELSNPLPSYITYGFDDNGYELNMVLEFHVQKMASDGGNNPNMFEVGNNLTIL